MFHKPYVVPATPTVSSLSLGEHSEYGSLFAIDGGNDTFPTATWIWSWEHNVFTMHKDIANLGKEMRNKNGKERFWILENKKGEERQEKTMRFFLFGQKTKIGQTIYSLEKKRGKDFNNEP